MQVREWQAAKKQCKSQLRGRARAWKSTALMLPARPRRASLSSMLSGLMPGISSRFRPAAAASGVPSSGGSPPGEPGASIRAPPASSSSSRPSSAAVASSGSAGARALRLRALFCGRAVVMPRQDTPLLPYLPELHACMHMPSSGTQSPETSNAES